MAVKTKNYEWMKLPAYLVGFVTAVAILLGAFGFRFSTPGDKWNEHDVQHVAEEAIHIEQFEKMDITLKDIDARHLEQQTLVEAIVRGECIENPVENLQRQGLIQKCSDLGIER